MRGHMLAAGLGCLIGVLSVGCASRRAGSGQAPAMGTVRDVEASARLAAEAGRFEAAVRGYAEARRAAIQAGNLRAGAVYALWAGQWAMAAGWGDQAELWLRLAEQEAVVLGDEELAVRALWTLARLRLDRNDLAGAQEAVETALTREAGWRGRPLERDLRLLRAEVALRHNEAGRARQDVAAIPRRWSSEAGTPAAAMADEVWGGILEAEGRREEAAGRLERAAAGWERNGRPERAVRAWERSASLWRAKGRADRGVPALLRAALLREALGDRPQAFDLVREAMAWADEAGLTAWKEWARRLDEFWSSGEKR